MPEPDLFHIFLGPLNRLDIPYLVTGAVASIVYGEVRVTHDIDLIVDLKRDDVENIAGAQVKPNRPNSLSIKQTRLDQIDKIDQVQVYKVAYAPIQNLTRAKSRFDPFIGF